MKVCNWISVTVLSVVVLAASVTQAVTTDVFSVKASITGAVQYVSVTNEVSKVRTNGVTIFVTNEVVKAEIQQVVIKNDDIINLALGRDLGTKVQKNEILAVTTRCGDGLIQWVVYDKDTTNILTSIGDFVPVLRAVGDKKNKSNMEDISTLSILPTGSLTNAFVDGSLSANVQSELDTNGCIKNATVTMIGWWENIIASNNWQTVPNQVSPQPVMIRKSTLKTQNNKPIGSLISE